MTTSTDQTASTQPARREDGWLVCDAELTAANEALLRRLIKESSMPRPQDETTGRYTSALDRADQHRIDIETRSFSGEKLKAETERRKTALIEAHRRVADRLEQRK